MDFRMSAKMKFELPRCEKVLNEHLLLSPFAIAFSSQKMKIY